MTSPKSPSELEGELELSFFDPSPAFLPLHHRIHVIIETIAML